jgi:phosphoglycolate phosphatase-like HAD superfamily hydrolase
MRGFGASYGIAAMFEPRPVDPKKPDPRAIAEMEAYDLLPAEARAAVGDSPNDIGLAGKLHNIRARGCPRHVLARIRDRNLMPYQLGEGGILAEVVADELEKVS